jgi:hypothetical protein
MRVLHTGAALLLTRARLIAERCRRSQQSNRREQHDETLHSLHRFTSSQPRGGTTQAAQEFRPFPCCTDWSTLSESGLAGLVLCQIGRVRRRASVLEPALNANLRGLCAS